VGNPDLAGSANNENAAQILAWNIGTGGQRRDRYSEICGYLMRNDTTQLRIVVNGGTVGLDHFDKAYRAGKQLLQQGYHFRITRFGLSR
jgi:hypothetical protein